MTYKHLTREERYQIYALHRQGVSLAVIAAELMRSRSSITRELKRNAGPKGYRPMSEPAAAKAHGAMHASSMNNIGLKCTATLT